MTKKNRGRRTSTRLPESMAARWEQVVKDDGRSEAEFLRSLIGIVAPTPALAAAFRNLQKK